RPDVIVRQLLPHVGHDWIEALDDVRLRLGQGLVEVGLARHPGLTRSTPSTDRALAVEVSEKIRCARPQPMTRRAAACAIVHALTGGDERLWRYIARERERFRHL